MGSHLEGAECWELSLGRSWVPGPSSLWPRIKLGSLTAAVFQPRQSVGKTQVYIPAMVSNVKGQHWGAYRVRRKRKEKKKEVRPWPKIIAAAHWKEEEQQQAKSAQKPAAGTGVFNQVFTIPAALKSMNDTCLLIFSEEGGWGWAPVTVWCVEVWSACLLSPFPPC